MENTKTNSLLIREVNCNDRRSIPLIHHSNKPPGVSEDLSPHARYVPVRVNRPKLDFGAHIGQMYGAAHRRVVAKLANVARVAKVSKRQSTFHKVR